MFAWLLHPHVSATQRLRSQVIRFHVESKCPDYQKNRPLKTNNPNLCVACQAWKNPSETLGNRHAIEKKPSIPGQTLQSDQANIAKQQLCRLRWVFWRPHGQRQKPSLFQHGYVFDKRQQIAIQRPSTHKPCAPISFFNCFLRWILNFEFFLFYEGAHFKLQTASSTSRAQTCQTRFQVWFWKAMYFGFGSLNRMFSRKRLADNRRTPTQNSESSYASSANNVSSAEANQNTLQIQIQDKLFVQHKKTLFLRRH